MADQSVALDVKVPTYDVATPLSNAQTILGNQTRLQMLGRENVGQDITARNQLIRDAAAHALDSDSWDTAMRSAVQRGAPEAQQYVGRYTPLLQQRLFDAYAGAARQAQGAGAAAPAGTASSAANGGTAPSNQYDRMYANATPEQLAQSLQKNNMVLAALSTVRDEASYNAAIAKLQAAGIPNAAQIAGPYNPLRVVQLWNDTQQRVGYLQSKVASAATGATNEQLVPIPWKVTTVKDSFGQERAVAYNPDNPAQSMSIKPNASATNQPAAPTGSPFDAFAKTMNQAESGGNATAKNPLSSATGAGQFIDQTWLDTIKSARPDLVKGLDDKQILALRSNPQLSQEMTADYARQNATKLSDAGMPVTGATLALAHRLGPAGALTVLNAKPDTPLADILPKKVMAANPQLAGMTAGQYATTTARQFGNAPMNAAATAASPKLEDFDMASVDPNLRGWDYAKQFPAEVQDAARAYMNGGVMPTGNPRNQGIVTMAKMMAQKVAADLGRPELADDTLYPQRRQMQVELAKTTAPAAVGGQITFGGTALGHLAQYATDLADLHNVSGVITPVGHAVNWMRALGPEQAEKVSQAKGDAEHYGQEIAKFYGGGNSGVAERERFLNNADPANKTPQELAGVVRAERNLIPERYAQIRANIENVLGPEAATKALARLNVEGSMSKIDAALAKLDPTGPEATKLRNAATAGVDPRDAAALRQNSHNPAAAAAIDKKYGAGTAVQILGQE